VLHGPKLLASEKQQLSADQLTEELRFEEQFREELLRTIQRPESRRSGWMKRMDRVRGDPIYGRTMESASVPRTARVVRREF
jgi:hypothetical protein